MPPPHPTPAPSTPGGVRPHPALTEYYADANARRQFVDGLFDDTAADYDRIERVLAFGSGRWYRRSALERAGVREGMRLLDVGCGTGLVAREALALVGPAGSVTGVDPSRGMLGAATTAGVRLVVGRAEALPCANASADALTMGYALRHIDDLARAFAEFHRVLTPGGRVLILEITRPQGRLATLTLRTYMRALVPLIARVVARRRATSLLWRYYWDTIEACVPPQTVMQALRDAGFTQVRREVQLGIFCEYTALKTGPSGTRNENQVA